MLKFSFEEKWTDSPVGNTTNQIPGGWELSYIPVGNKLRSEGVFIDVDHTPVFTVAKTIPECVHKGLFDSGWNLPPDERPGGVKALILEGVRNYKIFSNFNPFGVRLRRKVSVPAGTKIKLTWPVQVHHQGDGSPGAATWRVGIDDTFCDWKTFQHGFEDRTWVNGGVEKVVAGDFYIVGDFESRAEAGIDFFMDNITVEILEEEGWYDATAMVVDFTYITDEARRKELYLEAMQRGIMVGPSHDHAATWPPGAKSLTVLIYDLAVEKHEEYLEYYRNINPKIKVLFNNSETPPTDWEPTNYVPKGTKLGWHAIGSCGIQELHKDTPVPTVKLVQAIGDIGDMPATYKVVRLIDHPEYGNLEGFNYTGDPIAQAESRIGALAKILEPLKGKFDFAEYINEQEIPGMWCADAIGTFCKRASEVAPEWLKLAHFSFSTGNPANLEYWKPVADTGVFEQIARRGEVIALHAYHDHRKPGDIEHHLLRHRYLYNNYILPQKLNIPMILTECGPTIECLADPTFNLRDWIGFTDEALRNDPYAMAQMYTLSDGSSWKQYNDAFRQETAFFANYVREIKDRVNGKDIILPPVDPPTGYPWDKDLSTTLPTNPNAATKWFRRKPSEITNITIHHTHTNASWEAIAKDHIARDGGTETIHYTIGIDKDATINLLTPLDLDKATHPAPWHDHTGWRNVHLAITLLGSYHITPPTIKQLEALVKVCAWAIREERLPKINSVDQIKGHIDFYGTACPGWISAKWKPVFFDMLNKELENPPIKKTPLLGFNDHPGRTTGIEWLHSNNIKGYIVRPMFIGGNGSGLDFSKYTNQKVVVNLRYSWSTDLGGGGTCPKPYTEEWNKFLNAMEITIKNSKNVWGWEILNEYNNPREFPKDYNLTPEDIVLTYNEIRKRVPGFRLSPGALDPFHSTMGEPRIWFDHIWKNISNAEFVCMHGYTRGPEADLVNSKDKFQDEPMTWQYLNYTGCVETLLTRLPIKYRNLEVHITELNHLFKVTGNEDTKGWVNDQRASEVVRRFYKESNYDCLALYRWAGDEWKIEDNNYVLDTIKSLSST